MRKRRMLMTAIAGAMIACGAVSESRADDRVNLWPLVYHDSGDTYVAWPLMRFSEYRQNWIFPVFWDSHELTIFPLFWHDPSMTAILPFVFYDKGFAVFPLWWNSWRSGFSSCLFPAFYYNKDDYGTHFWAMAGLAGYWRNGRNGEGEAKHWLLPLYLSGDDVFATPLFGWTGECSWCFPIYYRDGDGIYSLPYTRTKVSERYLLGLAGRTFGEAGNSSWLFPLYYRNEDTWFTPLFGKSGNSSWCLPLYYHDDTGTVTLPLAWGNDGPDSRYVMSPLLPSRYSWSTESDNYSWFALAGLAGGEKKDSMSESWIAPLYYRHKDAYNDIFMTLPFGWDAAYGQTNTWWLTPLVGTRSGRKEGGWLFPLFSKTTDREYAERSAWIDAKTLPEELNIRLGSETNREYVSSTRGWKTNVVERYNADSFSAMDDTSVLVVAGVEKYVGGCRSYAREKDAEGRERDVYNIYEGRKSGNILVFRNESCRSVDFDLETRERIDESESVTSETSLFMSLFKRDVKKSADENRTHTRVLWKLWSREERNGDVSVDAFPGFTYDSKTNGYTKTSFLWRFFRYEKDPEKNETAVDFLFIPIWR